MRLIIFGAGGLLGTRLVSEALDRGHEVTAAGRNPDSIDDHGGRVRIVRADATDEASVAEAAAGHDAAVSAVTQHDNPVVMIDAARALLEGLARAGVPRLVVAGGAGSLKVASGERLLDQPDFHDEWKPEALAGADALERYRAAVTPVDWTFVSPGALLTPGERTGTFRTAGDDLLVDEHGHSSISMEDFAVAMLDEAEDPQHARSRFTAAY